MPPISSLPRAGAALLLVAVLSAAAPGAGAQRVRIGSERTSTATQPRAYPAEARGRDLAALTACVARGGDEAARCRWTAFSYHVGLLELCRAEGRGSPACADAERFRQVSSTPDSERRGAAIPPAAVSGRQEPRPPAPPQPGEIWFCGERRCSEPPPRDP
jgi:hypothetical protein